MWRLRTHPRWGIDFVNRSIELIRNSRRSATDLQRLRAALQVDREHAADATQVREMIRRTAPELDSLGDALPRTRQELYAFLSLIVAILTLVIMAIQSGSEPKIEIH